MDNQNASPQPETNLSFNPHSPSEKVREPLVFTARDWLSLPGSLALAVLYLHVFGLERLFTHGIPGLGITVFVFALFGLVLAYLGKRARYTLPNILLLAATCLLAAGCSIFGDIYLRILNCFIILAVGALTIFQLSGQAEKPWSRAAVIGETIVLSFTSLFCNIDKPFRAVPPRKEGRGHGLELLIGGIIAVPVLAIVLSLLISADAVFADMFGSIGDWFMSLNIGSAVWNVFKTIICALVLFSAVYSLRHHHVRGPSSCEPDAESASKEPGGALAFATVLVLLDIVYAVFVAIQIAFLFGGAETAAISGGYAEYARSGFFQLVAVAAINLAAVLTTCTFGFRMTEKKRPVLRGLAFLLLAMTCVILASAVWRMFLYISVYGLSLLRAMTLWGMLVIAVSLIVAAVKTAKPDTSFFPLFFAFTLSTWIIFNYINIDARIADYNVNAYLDGRLEEIDVDYLRGLSPDVKPALDRLGQATGERYDVSGYGASGYWAQWNLSWARHPD